MAMKKSMKLLRLEYWPAGKLRANPRNWREHSQGQRAAMRGLLERVGFVGAVLLNEQTGHLLDGHMRVELSDPEAEMPVLIGRWSEGQERLILASRDPMAAMAVADGEALEALLEKIAVDDPAIQAIFEAAEQSVRPRNLKDGSGERSCGEVARQAPGSADGMQGGGGDAEGVTRNVGRKRSYQVVITCKGRADQRKVLAGCEENDWRGRPVELPR